MGAEIAENWPAKSDGNVDVMGAKVVVVVVVVVVMVVVAEWRCGKWVS